MKFAHEFKEALSREGMSCSSTHSTRHLYHHLYMRADHSHLPLGYPTRWLDSAIPYSQLKKCLKKVQRELRELGLDPETLQQLLAAHALSSEGDPVPVAKYNLDGE